MRASYASRGVATQCRLACRAALLGALIGVAGGRAHAQDASQLTARRQLIEQAQRAATAGNFAQAADLAERAGRIQMTPSLELYLATWLSRAGRIAEAYGHADRCFLAATNDSTIPERASILAGCRDLVRTLGPQLARVTVRPPSPLPEGLRVTVAGRALDPAFYGVAYALDAGEIVVEASAPGRQSERRTVTVAAGGTAEVALVMPEVAATPAPAPVATPAPAAPRSARGVSPAPIVVIAAGAVGFIVTGVLFGLRNDADGQLRANCDPQTTPGRLDCPDTSAARSAFATADGYNTATNAMIGVSTGILAVGVAWLIADRVMASRERAGARVRVLPAYAGLQLRAEW